MKQVIHAANIGGIENLYKQSENDYLCCSSLGCPDYFHRDVLFLVEGKVTREYWGDIGSIGMSPKKTDYDEVHIEGEFDILGLYVPDNMEFFDLRNYAIAKLLIEDWLQIPVKILNANPEQLAKIKKFENGIQNDGDTYYSTFEEYGYEEHSSERW